MSGVVLCFHRVIDKNMDGGVTPWHARGTALTPETFTKHLDDIQEHFTVLDPKVLYEESIPDGGVVLTFDDVTPELGEFIIPEMEKRGMRGAVFPVTSVFEGRVYSIDRFYDAVNQCYGREFHFPEIDGEIRTILMTNSEVKRIVNSNLKRRIVGLGEDGHHIVDQIFDLNGLSDSIVAKDIVDSIHAAHQKQWLIGLHGHNHLSFSLHDDDKVWNDIAQAKSILIENDIVVSSIIAATDGRLPRGVIHNQFRNHNFLSIAQSFDGKGVIIPFQERWIVPPRNNAILEVYQNGTIQSVEQHEEGLWHHGERDKDWVEVQLDSVWKVEKSPFRTKKNRSLHYAVRKKDRRQAVLKVHELQVLDESEFEKEILHLIESQGHGVVELIEHGYINDWGDEKRCVRAYATERLRPLTKSIQRNEALRIWREMVLATIRINNIGFVHCDIKPGNILIDDSNKPKLIDFAESLKMENQVSRDKVFKQEDVYNLGKLLHRLMTGDRVYVLPAERILAQDYNNDANGEIKLAILSMCNPNYRERPSIDELMQMSLQLLKSSQDGA